MVLHVYFKPYDFRAIYTSSACGLCSFNLLLAHLSHRLIGELIGYSWSGVRLSASSSFTMLKDILLRNGFGFDWLILRQGQIW